MELVGGKLFKYIEEVKKIKIHRRSIYFFILRKESVQRYKAIENLLYGVYPLKLLNPRWWVDGFLWKPWWGGGFVIGVLKPCGLGGASRWRSPRAAVDKPLTMPYMRRFSTLSLRRMLEGW